MVIPIAVYFRVVFENRKMRWKHIVSRANGNLKTVIVVQYKLGRVGFGPVVKLPIIMYVNTREVVQIPSNDFLW